MFKVSLALILALSWQGSVALPIDQPPHSSLEHLRFLQDYYRPCHQLLTQALISTNEALLRARVDQDFFIQENLDYPNTLLFHIESHHSSKLVTDVTSIREVLVSDEMIKRAQEEGLAKLTEQGTNELFEQITSALSHTIPAFKKKQGWTQAFLDWLVKAAYKYDILSNYINSKVIETDWLVGTLRMIHSPYWGHYSETGQFILEGDFPLLWEDYLGVRVKKHPVELSFKDRLRSGIWGGEHIELGNWGKDNDWDKEVFSEQLAQLLRLTFSPTYFYVFKLLGLDLDPNGVQNFNFHGKRFFTFATKKTLPFYALKHFVPVKEEELVSEFGEPVHLPILKDGEEWTPMETTPYGLLNIYMDLRKRRHWNEEEEVRFSLLLETLLREDYLSQISP